MSTTTDCVFESAFNGRRRPLRSRVSPFLLRSYRSARALTLLEAMIVLALLAWSSGLVLARFDSWIPRSKIRSAANQLAVDIRGARHRAVVEYRAFMIHYETNTGIYEVAPEAPRSNDETRRRSLPPPIVVHLIDSGDEDSRSANRVSVRFDPSGIVKKHVLVLEDESERQISLVVNAMMNTVDVVGGKIEIREGHR